MRLPLYSRKPTQLGHRAMSEKCRKSFGIIQSPDPRMTDGPTIIPANHLVFHFGELHLAKTETL
jgi:hypothetical protein